VSTETTQRLLANSTPISAPSALRPTMEKATPAILVAGRELVLPVATVCGRPEGRETVHTLSS
jgi:hypothetical protein